MLWLLLLLLGCPSEVPPDLPPEAEGTFEVGDAIACDAPVAGFDRFTETAEERGIDLVYEGGPSPGSCALIPGAVAAIDADADGAVDLLFQNPAGFPHVYWNDGTGRFTRGDVPHTLQEWGRSALGFAVVDLDGDGLRDVSVSGLSFVATSKNLGDRQFADFEVLWKQDAFPRVCINSLGWGDVDGDGDLDLALPTLDSVAYEGAPPLEPEVPEGHVDLLLLLEDGRVVDTLELRPAAGVGLSVVAAMTDREGDGSPELMIASDRGFFAHLGPTALYVLEALDGAGRPLLSDRAPDLELDLRVDGMGVDARDVNGDGQLDYCFSDVEFHLTCATSAPGGYVLSGPAMNLLPVAEDHPQWPGDGLNWIWSTWGVEWVDLDNDGVPDLAAAGGPPPPDTCGEKILCQWQPDALYRGLAADRFENRSLENDFASPEPHFGLASADLDGDGYRELILGPWAGRPEIRDNPCGAEGWLEVSLVGPPGNRDAIGARVTVTSSLGAETQQLWSLRGVSQGPGTLHFGLGSADEATIEVLWPGGATSRATVGARRVVTALHPDA